MENYKRPGVPVYTDNKGNRITKDEFYSKDFWQKQQPVGTKEAMQETIEKSLSEGVFYNFVGFKDDEKSEIDEKSKEKLSAYRILAKEMGFEIGPFKLNKNSETVEATIVKIK